MLRISNTKVYDLVESVIASGNAMRLEPLQGFHVESGVEFQKGLERMKKLVKASEGKVRCHKNALCGIRVSFDVVYPQYWTPESQRYHWLDIVTSSSKMHRLRKMEIRKATNKYVSPYTIREEQYHVDQYNKVLNDESITEFGYWNTEGKTDSWVVVKGRQKAVYAAFMVMVSNCPLGLELFERISTNYLQLANIYPQRRHHRLEEDWGAFCDWIEGLPYAKELIIGEE